jgi:Fe-S cluster assembly iron-binding protein IscA
MLQVSDTAAIAFREFLDRDDVPGTAIRLEPAAGPSEDSSAEIRMSAVDAPTKGDVRAAATGVDIFVAPELSEPLDDAILDAEVTPQGAQLVLRKK